jgi:hypothetical protein
MQKTVPDLIDRVLKQSVAKLERVARAGRALQAPARRRSQPLDGFLPLHVYTEPDPDGQRMRLHAEFTVGRQSWLSSMRHLLSGTARVLSRHSWSILYPDSSTEWVTSDHPLIRLNYHERGR